MPNTHMLTEMPISTLEAIGLSSAVASMEREHLKFHLINIWFAQPMKEQTSVAFIGLLELETQKGLLQGMGLTGSHPCWVRSHQT
jgi:hypothetical protein